MSQELRILAFAGSLRDRSFNKRALSLAVRAAELAGSEVTVINLKDYPMPIYNPDEHAKSGLNDYALEFQRLLALNRGLLIATPEYNGSFPAALKNVFEWATRPNPVYDRKALFLNKFAALISASPGPLGGVKSLTHLRGVLSGLGIDVLAQEVVIPFIDTKFDEGGDELVDVKTANALSSLGTSLVNYLRSFEKIPT